MIWGAGPVLSLPIGSDALLTNGKYCLGAAGVICKTKFPWVTGLMVQNMWSVYGDPSKKYVNQLLSYPFVNYNFKDCSFISFVPTITADWTSNVNNRWVLPLGLGVGKVTNIGKQPVSLSLSAYKNVMKPDNYPDWQFRFTFSLLFPD